MESLYGNYRTRKLTDVWSKHEDFIAEYNAAAIPTTITDTSATTLYYLLYARYGNSTILSSDENQFKYKLWSIIFQYGPTWEKRLDVQSKLRNLTDTELEQGTKMIYNHSYNPSSAPSTSTLDELTTINEQNTQSQKRNKLNSYAILMELLKTDVTEEFIGKFKKLFLVVVEPEEPLWYVEGEEE